MKRQKTVYFQTVTDPVGGDDLRIENNYIDPVTGIETNTSFLYIDPVTGDEVLSQDFELKGD